MRHATMLRLCGELSQPPVTAQYQYPLAASTTTSGGTSCGVEAGGRSCSGASQDTDTGHSHGDLHPRHPGPGSGGRQRSVCGGNIQ